MPTQKHETMVMEPQAPASGELLWDEGGFLAHLLSHSESGSLFHLLSDFKGAGEWEVLVSRKPRGQETEKEKESDRNSPKSGLAMKVL